MNFVIYKSYPVISVKSGKVAVKNNGISASNVTVIAFDLFTVSKSVTLNGRNFTWPKNSVFSKEGKYVVTVKDQYGHSSKTSFIIDKTAPKVAEKRVKGGVIVTVTESNLSAKMATLNGKKITWPKGGRFIRKGGYVITVLQCRKVP